MYGAPGLHACGHSNRPQYRPRRRRPPPQLRHSLLVPGLSLVLWPPLLLPLLLLLLRELAVRLVAERGDGGGPPACTGSMQDAGGSRGASARAAWRARAPNPARRQTERHGRLHGCWRAAGCMDRSGGCRSRGPEIKPSGPMQAGGASVALAAFNRARAAIPAFSIPCRPLLDARHFDPPAPVNQPLWRPSPRRYWSGAPSTTTAGCRRCRRLRCTSRASSASSC